MQPIQPDPDAPTDIALLPNYWDARRERDGKPDLSRCGAELRIALDAQRKRPMLVRLRIAIFGQP
jgi:hypothetical protein